MTNPNIPTQPGEPTEPTQHDYDNLMAGINALLDENHPVAQEIREQTGLDAGVIPGDPNLTAEQDAIRAGAAALERFLPRHTDNVVSGIIAQIEAEGGLFGTRKKDEEK